MKKKLVAGVLAVGVLLGTAGCATGAPDAETGKATTLYEQPITLSDGRTVTCVVHSDGYQGGLSCDWSNAK